MEISVYFTVTPKNSHGDARLREQTPETIVIDGSRLTARGVAVAECPFEDGPRLEPLSIATSRRAGDGNRRFPCKPHIPVELGTDGFDIIYKLWTLPYNFLTRIVCATASVIVRRRRGPQARIEENCTTPRSVFFLFIFCTPAIRVKSTVFAHRVGRRTAR